MSVEVALIISLTSAFFAIFFGVINMRRNQKADDKREQSDMTTVIVKLEAISSDTTEIKSDIKSLKEDVRNNRDNIIRIDESLKSAWKAITDLQKKGE